MLAWGECLVEMLHPFAFHVMSVSVSWQFGISIADDEEGPFYVELQYVKVIRNYDPCLYSTTDRLLESPSKKIDRIPR